MTIDNAGTAKQSGLDATMAKHRLGVEDVVLHTRKGLEEAANAQIARFESQVMTLRDNLRKEAEDQTLAFEDLAAHRLVELEERLSQAVDSLLTRTGVVAELGAAGTRDSGANGPADLGSAPSNGLGSATSG